ncbi:ATP-binding protein [Streptomyces sp. NPDC057486]|uniref:AAA family ATPase n=1 Tax=Streptomyces sp. NPDC057486 TaxID=3346145 RepID=UPI0036CF993F
MRSATATAARPKELFDREAEWDALVAFARDPRPGPAVAIVTGPRRQGKSFLLQQLTSATGGFYFGAQDVAEAESLRRLGDQLARHTGANRPTRWNCWADALDAFATLASERPLPVVIDGFPELVRQSPALPSAVNSVCRRLREAGRSNRVRLLLCGSAMPMMRRLLGTASTSADLQLKILPLDFRQGARLWNIDDPRLALQVHAVVGASTAFRYDPAGEDIPAGPDDFDAWVCRTVLNPRLPLLWKAGHIIEQEPDGWDRGLCHSTLAAIADGCSTPGAIADWLDRPATEVPHLLAVLHDCGLVQGVPDAFRPGVTRYRITEPLLAFDHAVIRPNRIALGQQGPAEVWKSARSVFESAVVRPHFAQVCRDWVTGFASRDTFGPRPVTASAGSLPRGQGHRPVDVDVVVRGEVHGRAGVLLSVGRACWDEVMDVHHLHEQLQVLAELADRGEDVSRARPACYSAAGFSPRLREAEARGEVVLVDPDRLYHGE